MKHLILAIGICLSLIVVGQVPNTPSILFMHDKTNFGSINEDVGSVYHEFKFVNVGKKPLKIENVLTTCGCTTPNWTQTEVKQGDTGVVVAQFNPENKDGRFSKNLTVITNGSPRAVTLTIEGVVYSTNKSLLAMFPAKIGNLSFSTKQLELTAQKEDKIDTVWLGVFNSSNENIFIRKIISPNMMYTSLENLVLKPESGDNIMFTYNGALGKSLGPRLDSIFLVTSDKDTATKLITIKANIVQNFDKLTAEQKTNAPIVNVKQLEGDVGQLFQGETGTFTYELTNTGKSDLVIKKVFSDCACITSKIPQTIIPKGAKGKILVSFNSKRKHGNVEQKFTLITNDPKQPETKLKLKAKVVIPGKEPVIY